LTSFLPVLFLKGSFLKFINKTGSEILFRFNGIFRTDPENGLVLIRQITPVLLLIIMIIILAFITIFFYKKRKLQHKLTLIIVFLTLLLAGTFVYYSFTVAKEFQVVPVPGFKMFVPLLMLLFEILAYKGIIKDEKLVSSYDRLR
jgi:glucan phosphoethanolaminetransferase (alkaline phosphatase superfamily)